MSGSSGISWGAEAVVAAELDSSGTPSAPGSVLLTAGGHRRAFRNSGDSRLLAYVQKHRLRAKSVFILSLSTYCVPGAALLSRTPVGDGGLEEHRGTQN